MGAQSETRCQKTSSVASARGIARTVMNSDEMRHLSYSQLSVVNIVTQRVLVEFREAPGAAGLRTGRSEVLTH